MNKLLFDGARRFRWLPCAAALLCSALLAACSTSTTTTATPLGQSDAVPATPDGQARRKAALIRLDLATNYLGIGKPDVAMEEVGNALAIDPSLTDAYLVRGLVYAQRQDFANAEADYNRVLQARPNDPDVIHNVGFLKCQQSRFDEAQDWFSRALATPGYQNRARTLMAQGLCLQSAGKPHEAIDALKQAHALDSANPIVGYNLASLLYQRGEVANAQGYLRRLNASGLANAETLWLGIKVENALGNQLGVRELGGVLASKFPQSREYSLYERKAFYE